MVDEDLISYGLKKVNANVKRIGQVLDGILEGYPKVSGSGSQYLSNSGQQSLIKANTYLKEFNDEFVTFEHLFLAILNGNDQVANLLKDAGVKSNEIIKAFKELRAGTRATSSSAESQYNSLNKY